MSKIIFRFADEGPDQGHEFASTLEFQQFLEAASQTLCPWCHGPQEVYQLGSVEYRDGD